MYPNFPDLDLQDWAHAYYGENHDRLLRVKANTTPTDLSGFTNPSLRESLGPAKVRQHALMVHGLWTPTGHRLLGHHAPPAGIIAAHRGRRGAHP